MRILLMSVIAISLAMSPLAAQTCGLAGDVNGDRKFDFADPKALLEYLFSNGSLACPQAADANRDGSVDIADAVTMLSELSCAAAIPGDANHDTVLDMTDVKHILAYLFEGGPSPVPCVEAADYNQDGQVDIADPTALSAALCAAVVPGDTNDNGLVDIGDLIVVFNYLFNGGPPPEPCVLAGDVNSDGNVDIADVITYLGLF